MQKLLQAGFVIENVAVQIIGNKPKIGPRRADAIAALSKALGGALWSQSLQPQQIILALPGKVKAYLRLQQR